MSKFCIKKSHICLLLTCENMRENTKNMNMNARKLIWLFIL